MPADWGDLEVLCEHGGEQMVSLLRSAITNEVMPPSVLLAQIIQVLPRDLTVSFEIPTLIRREYAKSIIPPIVFHGAFVRRSGLSLFRNAVEELKSHERERGIICTVSNESVQPNLTISSADMLRVLLTTSRSRRGKRTPRFKPLQVDLDDLGVNAPEWGLIRTGRLAHLIEGVNGDTPSPPSVQPFFDDPHGLKIIFGDTPSEYLSHMAPIAAIGHIVICVPRLYAFDSTKNELEDMGGGGCFFVVEGELNVNLLESLYLIAHKMCSAVSGMQEVARAVSDETFAKTFRFISHSLKNSVERGIPPNASKEMVGRALTLERYTAKAAGALKNKKIDPQQVIKWDTGGFNGEPVGRTIEEALSSSSYKVNLDDSSIKDAQVDPRLVAGLVELARNLSRHHPSDEGEATIRIQRDKRSVKAISIQLATKCIYDDVQDLIGKLLTKSGGVNWVVLLLGRLLAPREGGITWEIKYAKSRPKSRVVEINKDDKARWLVLAPPDLSTHATQSHPDLLLMEFRVDGIVAII